MTQPGIDRLSTMPAELQSNILERLSIPEAARMRLVSKRWKVLVDHNARQLAQPVIVHEEAQRQAVVACLDFTNRNLVDSLRSWMQFAGKPRTRRDFYSAPSVCSFAEKYTAQNPFIPLDHWTSVQLVEMVLIVDNFLIGFPAYRRRGPRQEKLLEWDLQNTFAFLASVVPKAILRQIWLDTADSPILGRWPPKPAGPCNFLRLRDDEATTFRGVVNAVPPEMRKWVVLRSKTGLALRMEHLHWGDHAWWARCDWLLKAAIAADVEVVYRSP